MEDINLEQKQRQCYRQHVIAQGEEAIPEKDMQLLKDFLHTILNAAKLPDTAIMVLRA